MKLLPQKTFTLQTPDPLPLVRERLSAKIVSRTSMRSQTDVAYRGAISQDGFEISRVIGYRNSALPVIRGRFEPLANGTAIHISMGIHPFVAGFLGFWYLSWYSAVGPIV
ncbi:MAG: hypothetical protein WCD18_01875, partial [Thermosynechococcaceae cyanobacterium]